MKYDHATREFRSTNEGYLYHELLVNGVVVAVLPSPLVNKKTGRKENPYYGAGCQKSIPTIHPLIEAAFPVIAARVCWKVIAELRKNPFGEVRADFAAVFENVQIPEPQPPTPEERLKALFEKFKKD